MQMLSPDGVDAYSGKVILVCMFHLSDITPHTRRFRFVQRLSVLPSHHKGHLPHQEYHLYANRAFYRLVQLDFGGLDNVCIRHFPVASQNVVNE